MSDRKSTTAKLSEMLEQLIDPNHDPRIYWAREVTFDYATDHAGRVDYMRFKPRNNTVSGIEKGDFYCYEVKSSVEDFHSKNGHNLIGDFNYYVMPASVLEVVINEIPHDVGVYCPAGPILSTYKTARRMDRNKPLCEMLLMMYRSARRDARKDENDG